MNRDVWPVLALLVLAAVLFFANTWGYELWPADEPRFGEVPREMMQSGDYLIPHCNGEPYKEKPPLLFWAIVAASLPFGDVTEFSARAPSGFAALITVLFTYLLAAKLYDRRTAFWSALVLMTTSFFWWEARSSRTDMLLTASMTACLFMFWQWHTSKTCHCERSEAISGGLLRYARNDGRRTRWLVAFYGALALGLFTKGPAALVFPLLLIFSFYWKRPEERRQTHWIAGVSVALLPVLAWFLYARLATPAAAQQAGQEGMGGELFRQIIGRAILGVSKAQWPWYYVLVLPLCLLPWSLYLPWAIPWVWRRRAEDERMRLLWTGLIPAFVFFSLCIGKREVYILPLYPVMAIFLARSVLELASSDRASWRKGIACAWGILLLLMGGAMFALPKTPYPDLWGKGALVFGLWAVLFGVMTLQRAFRTDMKVLHVLVPGHFAALAIVTAIGLFPALNAYKGTGDFCRPLRELSLAKTDYRLYSVGFSREEYVFYTRHFHTRVLNDLLPVQLPHPQDTIKAAKQQQKLRHDIAKAVDKIPVASLADPTAADMSALLEAVHGAIANAKVDPELAAIFQQVLTEAIQQFAREFDGPAPSFMFVQEEDWKWLIPLFPDLARNPLISRDSVGVRDVLLIANKAGAELLKPIKTACAPGT